MIRVRHSPTQIEQSAVNPNCETRTLIPQDKTLITKDDLLYHYGTSIETINDRGGMTPLQLYCLDHRIKYRREMEIPQKQSVAHDWMQKLI